MCEALVRKEMSHLPESTDAAQFITGKREEILTRGAGALQCSVVERILETAQENRDKPFRQLKRRIK